MRRHQGAAWRCGASGAGGDAARPFPSISSRRPLANAPLSLPDAHCLPAQPDFPIIADPDRKIAATLGMLDEVRRGAGATGGCASRGTEHAFPSRTAGAAVGASLLAWHPNDAPPPPAGRARRAGHPCDRAQGLHHWPRHQGQAPGAARGMMGGERQLLSMRTLAHLQGRPQGRQQRPSLYDHLRRPCRLRSSSTPRPSAATSPRSSASSTRCSSPPSSPSRPPSTGCPEAASWCRCV